MPPTHPRDSREREYRMVRGHVEVHRIEDLQPELGRERRHQPEGPEEQHVGRDRDVGDPDAGQRVEREEGRHTPLPITAMYTGTSSMAISTKPPCPKRGELVAAAERLARPLVPRGKRGRAFLLTEQAVALSRALTPPTRDHMVPTTSIRLKMFSARP